jgi:hypothetical protein
MYDLIPIVLLATVPVAVVSLVVVSLCFQAVTKANQCLLETNAMLVYNNRRVVDAIVTPPGDHVPRIEAEVELAAKRRPMTDPYPAPMSNGTYYPHGVVDEMDDEIGGNI